MYSNVELFMSILKYEKKNNTIETKCRANQNN